MRDTRKKENEGKRDEGQGRQQGAKGYRLSSLAFSVKRPWLLRPWRCVYFPYFCSSHSLARDHDQFSIVKEKKTIREEEGKNDVPVV